VHICIFLFLQESTFEGVHLHTYIGGRARCAQDAQSIGDEKEQDNDVEDGKIETCRGASEEKRGKRVRGEAEDVIPLRRDLC
jgi:hypothetical protein